MTDVHGALTRQAELLDALLTPDPPPRRRWPYVVVALAVVAAASAVVGVAHYRSGPSGPPHPSTWDPRVQKYVDFVEKKRGLTFKHPVYVDFLSDAAFEKQVTADRDELSDDDLEKLDQYAGTLRALGLVDGDVDLFDEQNELRGTGVIGFYSYDDERLRIRGTEITPAVESTIVHELTHAVQDQNLDLGQRFAELDRSDDANASSAAQGFGALVEGDARRIEGLWRDQLSGSERAALDKEQKKGQKGFEKRAKNIPEVLVTMMAAPYDLGQALLAVAVQQGGDGAVDGLFRSPPRTDEQQLDPWTMLADHQGVLTVPEPEVPSGAKAFDEGSFGAISWLMVLSERLPAAQALTAVDGWGGDSYAAYQQDGVSCVSVGYRGDTPADLAQMNSALRTWVAKGPKKSAGVSKQDQTLVFHSCDPGKGAPKVASGRSQGALRLALTRTYLSLQLLKAGLDVGVARCGADRLVHELTPAQLNGRHLDKQTLLRAIQPCRKDR
ncbi:MAG TPA: hypothetical protein VFV89_03865 [Nocardioides sp.]|uniref:hypothetical protein n=1 Tax=Nocardioides sp. TaxID=35761 RepID=UPI002E2F38F7|nr:hypothetical protein [Nocardioides sp.]HEX5086919.1 hypothetical protein [Nocardioides sp.]